MNQFANSFPLALSYISWDTFILYEVVSLATTTFYFIYYDRAR